MKPVGIQDEYKEMPFIIKDFFKPEEMQEFRSFMQNLMDTKHYIFLKDLKRAVLEKKMDDFLVDHYLGRIQCSINIDDLPEKLRKTALAYAHQINPNVVFRYVSFVRYSTDFGVPQLGPHFDPPTNEHFMFDVQIDSNVDTWPIVVVDYNGDVKEWSIDTNECLILDITRQPHWRKPMKFEEGDYLDMLFFSFIDERIESPLLEWQAEEGLKYMDGYNKELNLIYPGTEAFQAKDSLQDEVRQNLIRMYGEDKISLPDYIVKQLDELEKLENSESDESACIVEEMAKTQEEKMKEQFIKQGQVR